MTKSAFYSRTTSLLHVGAENRGKYFTEPIKDHQDTFPFDIYPINYDIPIFGSSCAELSQLSHALYKKTEACSSVFYCKSFQLSLFFFAG